MKPISKQRRNLIDKFQKLLNTHPADSIIAASCANIAETYLLESLESYSKFLEENGYLDTDWRTEEPFAIDEFMNKERSKK